MAQRSGWFSTYLGSFSIKCKCPMIGRAGPGPGGSDGGLRVLNLQSKVKVTVTKVKVKVIGLSVTIDASDRNAMVNELFEDCQI